MTTIELNPGDVAIVYDCDENSFQLHLDKREDNDPLTEIEVILSVVFMRIQNDGDFRSEMLDWFAEQLEKAK